MVKEYCKKRVVIEAVQWTGDNFDEIRVFLPDLWMECLKGSVNSQLLIITFEGTLKASTGDYIIKGPDGDVYSCEPETFALTYSEVPPDSSGQSESSPL